MANVPATIRHSRRQAGEEAGNSSPSGSEESAPVSPQCGQGSGTAATNPTYEASKEAPPVTPGDLLVALNKLSERLYRIEVTQDAQSRQHPPLRPAELAPQRGKPTNQPPSAVHRSLNSSTTPVSETTSRPVTSSSRRHHTRSPARTSTPSTTPFHAHWLAQSLCPSSRSTA